ncbi:MAG: hypothetical protein PVG07_00540 [Acidobacteriota bacterium]|jgi:hypothetical protein
MPKKAGEFVTKISQDPKQRDRFLEDPDAVMDEHGDLSDEDKQVLRTKDSQKIKDYLGDDGPPGCFVIG